MEKSNRPAVFAFRQRIGNLNWKQISSCNIEEIITHLKIHELQEILDHITFSEITSEDIKRNNLTNILILIQLYQLIIEYLLFHQENQFQTINQRNKKIHNLQDGKERLKEENLRFQEDIKTYKRQLHILRKALQGNGKLNPLEDPFLQKGGPRILYPQSQFQQQPDSTTTAAVETKEIIKTLVDHEYDSRRMMSSLLEEQRKSFHHEMMLLIDSMKSSLQSTNNNVSSNSMESYQLLMENMKLQFQQLIQSTLETQKANNNNNNLRQSLGDGKSLALQSLQQELFQKEKLLFEREESLQRREQTLNNASANHESKQRLYFHRIIALKTFFNVFGKGKSRKSSLSGLILSVF